MTAAEPGQQEASGWVRSAALAQRAIAMERVIYTSIGRAILRRPAIPTGAKGFLYAGGAGAIFAVFIGLAALELVIFDLIFQRWLVARIVIDALDLWGLIWMIGILCAHRVRPHTVGPEGIQVRDGLELDVHLAWDDVLSVAVARHRYEPKAPHVDGADPQTLRMKRHDETNIEIELERPLVIPLPGRLPAAGEVAFVRVRLWADQPREFLAEAGRYLQPDGQATTVH